jgi:hypothetical protein
MSKFVKLAITALVCLAIWACVDNANKPANTNAGNANTANANTAATKAAPTADALLALENKAFEAYKAKDGKWFEGFLNDKFVMFGPAGRVDKAGAVKMISEDKCDVKSFSFSEPHVTPVTSDVYVLTVKAEEDITCDGKKIPTPVRAGTVYVRSGSEWKGAYHNEVPIKDVATATSGEKASPPPPPASKATESPATGTAPAADLTATLMAIEKSAWEAWKNKDSKILDGLLSKDMAAVGQSGAFTATKADTLKAWLDPTCNISSVTVSDGQAVEIVPGVAILTFKGVGVGKCGDMNVKPGWGTTVYFKEGDTWKAGYYFESPA